MVCGIVSLTAMTDAVVVVVVVVVDSAFGHGAPVRRGTNESPDATNSLASLEIY